MNEIVARNVVDNIVNTAETAAYFAARPCVEDGEVGAVYAKDNYSVYDDHTTDTRRRFRVTVRVEEVPFPYDDALARVNNVLDCIADEREEDTGV